MTASAITGTIGAVRSRAAHPASRRLERAVRSGSGRPAPAAARRMVVAASSQDEVHVTFQVERQVGPGEQLRVVGEPQVLGGWDYARAPTLDPPSEGSNLWSGAVDGLMVGSPFNFKFVVVPAADTEEPVWESIPDRTFQPGGDQTIKAVWDQSGFEAGPAAPGGQAAARGRGANSEVGQRLEATLRRLAEEGLAASKA